MENLIFSNEKNNMVNNLFDNEILCEALPYTSANSAYSLEETVELKDLIDRAIISMPAPFQTILNIMIVGLGVDSYEGESLDLFGMENNFSGEEVKHLAEMTKKAFGEALQALNVDVYVKRTSR